MIKNFFEKLKHLIASIFKDVPSLLAFEAVIATVLYTILFFRSEKDKISYLSLAFAFVSFAFTLNDSNKASKETKELNKSIQRLNSLLQENKTINSIETQDVACKEDFDNKTKLNDKTKIILFIIFFIFIIPFIVNYIVDIPSPFGFINDSNKEIWIPFLGTIIGGSITLFGVWWTIDNQKKQRRIDLAIQYKPVLIATLINSTKIPVTIPELDKSTYSGIFLLNIGDSKNKKFIEIITIKISNLGDGECYIKCSDNPFIFNNKINYNEESYNNSPKMGRLLLHKNWFNTIARKGSIYINFYIFHDINEKINDTFYLSFPFESNDMFNYNHYNNRLSLSLSIKFDDKDNLLKIKNDSILIENELIK